jgi:hydroxyacylglutathione hydrolase
MLEIHEIPVTPFQQNCTLLVCTATQKAVVCDCGEAAPVLAKIAELGVEVESIIATHGHLDHIGGTAELKRALQVDFWFPSGDDFWRVEIGRQAQSYGLPVMEVPEPDHNIVEGQMIQVGQQQLKALHCPGHTPGHMVFYHQPSAQLIAGDVLFQGSIGRTDFPRGSLEELTRSIREKLYILPAETLVHCGHGPTTTIGVEARTNPFVQA